MNVDLDCNISNLKRLRKMSKLPPSGKIFQTPMHTILSTGFGLPKFVLNFFATFSAFSGLQKLLLIGEAWFSRASHARRDCMSCLFEFRDLTMSNVTSLFSNVTCHQSYRFRVTSIDPDNFLDTYIVICNTYYTYT